MREIGQGSVPSSEPEGVTFGSLRMAESSERVDITLDERMLSIQGRRHTSIDIRINAIHTVKHHSSQLVPNWLLILGLSCIWIGYRLMVPPHYRLAFIAAGAGCILARFGTHQPTLTVQTTSGDTHVVFGNERALNQISFMFHHLANGKSMADVKALVQALEAGQHALDHQTEVVPAPILPDVLHAPRALDQFLANSGVNVELPSHEEHPMAPEWMPTDEPEPVVVNPASGFFPTFLTTQGGAQGHSYPSDHRPAPVGLPVLVPVQAPPMHQSSDGYLGPSGFIPSFLGRESAHIPHRTPVEETTPPEEPEPLLDLDQLETSLLEDVLDAEPAPRTVERPPEQLLQPKLPRTLTDTVFEPRKARTLYRRPGRRSGVLRSMRERSQDMLDSLTTRRDPSPYATSETSGAMRENAEEGRPPNSDVMASLREDEGGALPVEVVERLAQRSSTILAAAEEIEQQQTGDLDRVSFSDLQPSKTVDETVNIPRLDEE